MATMKLYTAKAASVGVIVFFIALSVIHMFVLDSCTEVRSCEWLFYKHEAGTGKNDNHLVPNV